MVQNPDAPESENKEPVVTTEKEEPVPVEAIERDVLEEDDDFEEFKEDHWNETPQNADEQLEWEDNWDDEECDDDFSKKLREELASAEAAETANA